MNQPPNTRAVREWDSDKCEYTVRYRPIESSVPRKDKPWQCRWLGCSVKGQPQFTGIHSVLRMGCHKVNCRRCGQTHEFMPA